MESQKRRHRVSPTLQTPVRYGRARPPRGRTRHRDRWSGSSRRAEWSARPAATGVHDEVDVPARPRGADRVPETGRRRVPGTAVSRTGWRPRGRPSRTRRRPRAGRTAARSAAPKSRPPVSIAGGTPGAGPGLGPRLGRRAEVRLEKRTAWVLADYRRAPPSLERPPRGFVPATNPIRCDNSTCAASGNDQYYERNDHEADGGGRRLLR